MARKRGRLGSVIRVRRLSGPNTLGNPGNAMGAAMPVVIGGGVAALTTIGIRQYMTPKTPTQMTLVNQAPWVGIGAGTLVSLAMWNMTGKPAGIASLTAALTVGIGMVVAEMAAKMRMAPTAGLGAVVPEYSMSGLGNGGRSGGGMGAIVMEDQASRGYGAGPLGAYGETVNLGAVNTSAFGTPGFQLGYGYGRQRY